MNQTIVKRYYQNTKGGLILICGNEQAIFSLEFLKSKPDFENDTSYALGKKACTQLQEYFSGERQQFDISCAPQGTPFQKRVWLALQKIPYGQLWTYKDLAELVECPKGYQAIGQANGKNPIPIIIPCHRVVAKNGPGGFSAGMKMKYFLIKTESAKRC